MKSITTKAASHHIPQGRLPKIIPNLISKALKVMPRRGYLPKENSDHLNICPLKERITNFFKTAKRKIYVFPDKWQPLSQLKQTVIHH